PVSVARRGGRVGGAPRGERALQRGIGVLAVQQPREQRHDQGGGALRLDDQGGVGLLLGQHSAAHRSAQRQRGAGAGAVGGQGQPGAGGAVAGDEGRDQGGAPVGVPRRVVHPQRTARDREHPDLGALLGGGGAL